MNLFNYKLTDPEMAEFIQVANLKEIPQGERLFLEVDGNPIVIFNIGGAIFAIGDTCTHDNGPLGDGDLEGMEIVCPRHGARFDVRTGKATSLPAIIDIPAYPVRIVDEQVEIGIPLNK